jgi:putative DNA primase/helicase
VTAKPLEKKIHAFANYPRQVPEKGAETYLRAVTLPELLKIDVAEREMVLHPFLPAQGLSMLYSKRGVGKTFISLGISVAVAAGTKFLRWNAPRPRGVLYVDGEMPLASIKERVCNVAAGMDIDHPLDNLRIITPDLQRQGLPDLSTVTGQDEVEQHLEGVSLLVLDNLSALMRSGKENEGEAWLPMQEWALDLRKRGISVLFDHHAGKAGAQRGTSRREDLLDSVVTLQHPTDYSAAEGLRCTVSYEKARGFFGDDAKNFEVRMVQGPSGECVWSLSDPEVSIKERASAMLNDGMSVRDVAEETGLTKSTVQRLKNRPWRDTVPTSER